jgi:hypothetical protein
VRAASSKHSASTARGASPACRCQPPAKAE